LAYKRSQSAKFGENPAFLGTLNFGEGIDNKAPPKLNHKRELSFVI